MSASAIIVMIIGITILWGGLAASIWNAFRNKEKTN
ncbi:methionine/alanine import family NSS transporter small subunit [Oceanobacillus alkalisoli]|nr:methionine/alanine import family NSS transporter small subunit [Oceanobacillus alkalisoli]MCF3943254.1 methionine/alanine import family NSS transporter small subunit [Oceanobacillus alkalisoli]MCG5103869.1 methionine/alanine import family NSS transporter small subunit [Oceanobacillus alkalisoli]